jgi:hypothetical protein
VSSGHKARSPNKKAGCAVSRTSGEEEESLEDDLDGQLHVELLTRAEPGSAVEVADRVTHETEAVVGFDRSRGAPVGGKIFGTGVVIG